MIGVFILLLAGDEAGIWMLVVRGWRLEVRMNKVIARHILRYVLMILIFLRASAVVSIFKPRTICIRERVAKKTQVFCIHWTLVSVRSFGMN